MEVLGATEASSEPATKCLVWRAAQILGTAGASSDLAAQAPPETPRSADTYAEDGVREVRAGQMRELWNVFSGARTSNQIGLIVILRFGLARRY